MAKKEKEYKISPQNQMSEERLKKAEEAQSNDLKPIVEIAPGEKMPLFMFISDLSMKLEPFNLTGNVNFMVTAIHLIKEDKII